MKAIIPLVLDLPNNERAPTIPPLTREQSLALIELFRLWVRHQQTRA